MARPKKQTVDYFPHDTDASEGRIVTAIQNKYGNDGYAFWFRVKELLGRSPGHFYDFNDADDWEFLLAKTHISVTETAKKILETLAILKAIDPELHKQGIIWSQDFVDSVEDVYKKRKENKPEKPNTVAETPISVTETPISVGDNSPFPPNTPPSPETKVKETKVYISGSSMSSQNDVLKTYKQNIGELTETIESELGSAIEEFTAEWVVDAIREAVRQNKRTWVYIVGILNNWKEFGKGSSESKWHAPRR